MYIHVCKMETLRVAYEMAKQNHGAPGVDGVTFAAIEEQGVEFLQQIQDELKQRTYVPLPLRKKKFRRTGAAKSASFRFRRSGIGWCKGR